MKKSAGPSQESEQKRAAAAGLYQKAFSRLMNEELESVPDLQAEANRQLEEAETMETGAAEKRSEK